MTVEEKQLISMGYLYKQVATPTENYLKIKGTKDIYSLAGCTSEDFADFIGLNKNNNYWLLNNLKEMELLATELHLSLDKCAPFFYKVYPNQWNNKKKLGRDLNQILVFIRILKNQKKVS